MNLRAIALFAIVLAVVAGLSYWAGTLSRDEADRDPSSEPSAGGATTYYCSMHPHITLPYEGKCSICEMDLIPLAERADDPGPRALELSEAAMRLAEVETRPVERKFVEATIAMVGKIEFDETEVKTITAWVDGRLDRLFVNYTGVPVAVGDHLVDIYSPKLYAAQQQLVEALNAVERTEPTNESLSSRFPSGNLDAVRTKLALLGLAEEQIAEIERRRTPSQHLMIPSPVEGVVVEKLASEGDYVSTGTPIYKVADLTRLWVKLDAYESDLPWLRYGQDVTFETPAYPGETFHGRVTFEDWVVDPNTRTVKVRLNVDNADHRLKPGMFVRAQARSTLAAGGRVMDPALAGKWISPMHPEIVKDGPGSCDICGMDLVPSEKLFRVGATSETPPLVIPASAPLITGRRAVVYVRRPDTSIFEGRSVVLGPRAGEHYVVTRGLDEGEEVVVRGGFKIDSALQIEAKPSMMQPEGGGPGGGGHLHGHSHAEERASGDPAGGADTSPPPAPTADDPEIRRELTAFYDLYREIGDALASDKSEGARAAATKAAAALPPRREGEESADAQWAAARQALARASERLARADSIVVQRSAFESLSLELQRAIARYGHESTAPVHEVHCPMAFKNRGALWLQSDETVRNPYFGAAMLRCGVKRSTHAPRDAGSTSSSPAKPGDEHSHRDGDRNE